MSNYKGLTLNFDINNDKMDETNGMTKKTKKTHTHTHPDILHMPGVLLTYEGVSKSFEPQAFSPFR